MLSSICIELTLLRSDSKNCILASKARLTRLILRLFPLSKLSFFEFSRILIEIKEPLFVKKKNKSNDLKKEIKEKEVQLKKLQAHVDKSSVCSDLYNKVVLEKAVLNKELQDLESDTLLNKVKKLMPKKKTLICDYFKNQ